MFARFWVPLLGLSLSLGGCYFSFSNPAEELAPGDLAGRVVVRDIEGGAFEGAIIRLSGTPLVQVTDARGRFRFPGLPNGVYDLQIRGRSAAAAPDELDLASQRLGLELEEGGTIWTGDIVLEPGGNIEGAVQLTGRALDDNAGVLVAIADTAQVGVSEGDGSVALRFIPAGTHQLTAAFPGFRAERFEISVRPGETTTFETLPLEPWREPRLGAAFGRVLLGDPESQDFANTLVRLIGMDGEVVPAVAPTDAEGNYRVLDVPEGIYTLSANHEGFQTTEVTGVTVIGGEVNQTLNGVPKQSGVELPTLVLLRDIGDCDRDGIDDADDEDDDNDAEADDDEDPRCRCNPVGQIFDDALDICLPQQLAGGNNVPVARVQIDAPQPLRVGHSVEAIGLESRDFDGDALTYRWTVVGPNGRLNVARVDEDPARIRFDVAEAGQITVILRVEDGQVSSLPARRVLVALAENVPPVASLVARDADGATVESPATLDLGDALRFDASGSSDPDAMNGDALSFAWALSPPTGATLTEIDGQLAQRRVVTTEAGSYTVTLTVSDGEAESQASFELTARPPCIDEDGDGFGTAESTGCAREEIDADDTSANSCTDSDGDGCDDCSGGSFDPAADGDDTDGDGVCDSGDDDDDGDGVNDGDDDAPADPLRCSDEDGDSCDDCSSGSFDAAADGEDFDGDGLCDAGDPDDDNDTVIDAEDASPREATSCADSDGDGCDDCVGGAGPNAAADGDDFDGDGLCDSGDPDDDNDGSPDVEDRAPLDASQCSDSDNDDCDDCTSGQRDAANDGADLDADGLCDVGDDDDDGDGVDDDDDSEPRDPRRCADGDNDRCDDCSVGTVDENNDGEDTDGDGQCNFGDSDDDNDDVPDEIDPSPLDPGTCGDEDDDTCDDCARGTADPDDDGDDFDGDGACDAGDPDDDNDTVADLDDDAPFDPLRCRDVDGDGCDDCIGGDDEPDDDGPDNDRDGLCDDGDPDDDDDGVIDAEDSAPFDDRECQDSDSDGCDDCSGFRGFDPRDDGDDFDNDGLCDLGDPDDDNDAVADEDDEAPFDEELCRDSDNDNCDDCSSGTDAPEDDGDDHDGDGACDDGDDDDDNDDVEDSDDDSPRNRFQCRDDDDDGCDDCSSGSDDPDNDGTDTDSDGACDDGDNDDDGDGVDDSFDSAPLVNTECRDADDDGCDDCSSGADDPANDGPDTDGDGRCDGGDSDDDGDGVQDSDDSAPSDPTQCQDLDGDLCDDCSSGIVDAGADGADNDADGLCDLGDPDDDNDGVADGADAMPFDPQQCQDDDADGCDDCALGPVDPSNDGTDTDGDGACDAGDLDDDGDGVPDSSDSAPLVNTVCRDADVDGCDDCSSGADDTAADGPDNDADGSCDFGDDDDDNDTVRDSDDSAPFDSTVCLDADDDSCDDCSRGLPNPADDGADNDGDGACDAGDADDDNDAVDDVDDSAPFNPLLCRDADGDSCDDCSSGIDNVALDGVDNDSDGICDDGDPDDDNDGVNDGPDTAPLNPAICADADGDGCDDCAVGTVDVANDGTDTDGDGACDAGDADDDNDGVADGADSAPLNNLVCQDTDFDNCDDCSSGTVDAADDGTDTDGDGSCDVGDLDDDDDGITDDADDDPLDNTVCRDADGDSCDDCSSGADDSANDGPDHDGDGSCDAGDLDDDNDGVPDTAEALWGSNAFDTDSDDDSIPDGQEDLNGNGVLDAGETSPVLPDTDGDGVCDGPRVDNDGDTVEPADACYSVWFVDGAAGAGGSGLNWANAINDIQAAIDGAQSGDEVWVKAGTYDDGGAGLSLNLRAGRALYGGFNGTEDDRALADPATNVTRLDGKNASIHVVDMKNDTILGGFLVIDGNALGSGLDDTGGGVFINGRQNVTVTHCDFVSNNADSAGGAIYVRDSTNVLIENSDFISNDGIGTGGGAIYTDGNNATHSVVIRGCYFEGNDGARGGAVYAGSPAGQIEDCAFYNNGRATWGGGIFLNGVGSTVTHCTFRGNHAGGWGGGVFLGFNGGYVVSNSIFVNNDADRGGGLYANPGTVRNCIFYNNGPAIWGGGIYAGTGTLIENNVVMNNSATNSGPQIFEGSFDDPIGTFDYNLRTTLPGTGNLNVNTTFVNAAGLDFALDVDGEAAGVDQGSPNPAFNDPDGTRNDMGAFGGPLGDWTPRWLR